MKKRRLVWRTQHSSQSRNCSLLFLVYILSVSSLAFSILLFSLSLQLFSLLFLLFLPCCCSMSVCLCVSILFLSLSPSPSLSLSHLHCHLVDCFLYGSPFFRALFSSLQKGQTRASCQLTALSLILLSMAVSTDACATSPSSPLTLHHMCREMVVNNVQRQ